MPICRALFGPHQFSAVSWVFPFVFVRNSNTPACASYISHSLEVLRNILICVYLSTVNGMLGDRGKYHTAFIASSMSFDWSV